MPSAVVTQFLSLVAVVLLGPCAGGLPDSDRLFSLQHHPPKWSSDGSRIVFVRGLAVIYSIASDGSDMKVIAGRVPKGGESPNVGGMNLAPQVSPDGAQVVYSHLKEASFWNPDEYWEIRIVNLDGSDRKTLGREELNDSDQPSHQNPSWSPDGSRIAFTSHARGEAGNGLYTMSANGSDVRKVISSMNVGAEPPAWSPDGKQLAFVGKGVASPDSGFKAYIVGIDGSGFRELGRTWTAPAWSPDGRRVALVGRHDGEWYVCTMRPDGSDLRRLGNAVHPWRFSGEYLSWSPDGAMLLFSRDRVVLLNADGSDIGGEPFLLLSSSEDASWSPDGSRIAISERQVARPLTQDAAFLFSVKPDGKDRKVLVRRSPPNSPDQQALVSESDWKKLSTKSSTPDP